jgi:LAO/AO transport system kinase
MEIANVFVVNKSDRPNAQVFVNHLKQMIAENASSQLTPAVVSTIATEREGISDLLKAIETHQLAMQDGLQKKEMYFNKVVQLIMATKMNQVDIEKVKTSLALECTKVNFNVFKFAQTFY